MRIGIGLPAAVPGASAMELGRWAAESERLGFQSLGVLDRLVYDNLDPLVALGAAAARTERAELITTVLGVPWRESAVVLGKQLASLDRLSGGWVGRGLPAGAPADRRPALLLPRPRRRRDRRRLRRALLRAAVLRARASGHADQPRAAARRDLPAVRGRLRRPHPVSLLRRPSAGRPAVRRRYESPGAGVGPVTSAVLPSAPPRSGRRGR